MKITFSEMKDWEEEILKKKFGRHKLRFFKGEINERNVKKIKDTEILVVFVNSEINKTVLDKLPKLKFIVASSTGFDNIDLEECKRRKIRVSNVPNYGKNTVAEYTFGLILSLTRKIHEGIDRTKEDNFSLTGLRGIDLKGKTIGVVGPGSIGQHVIKIAKGFEMKVLGCGKNKDNKLAKKMGFTCMSLNELLKKSDIITLHCPLNESTRHMINMKNINLIKKGSYLINTARGELVDTKALRYALRKGILAGAALDVLEGEEDIKDEKDLLRKRETESEDWKIFIRNHLLLKDKNVIVTPHSAFYTKEAMERILDETMDNVNGFLRGKVRNKVV